MQPTRSLTTVVMVFVLATALSNSVDAFVSTSTLHPSLEFEGYMLVPKESRFVISDPVADKRSGWLTIGDRFEGFTIVAFDSKGEIISLKNGNETIRLRLKAVGSAEPMPFVPKIPRSTQSSTIIFDGHPIIGPLVDPVPGLLR